MQIREAFCYALAREHGRPFPVKNISELEISLSHRFIAGIAGLCRFFCVLESSVHAGFGHAKVLCGRICAEFFDEGSNLTHGGVGIKACLEVLEDHHFTGSARITRRDVFEIFGFDIHFEVVEFVPLKVLLGKVEGHAELFKSFVQLFYIRSRIGYH